MGTFWWNAKENKRSLQWLKWDTLCLSKSHGGLGFKDLEAFNQSLIAKQGWRIIHQPDCLLSRLVKSIYFPHSDFLQAPMGYRPSYGWRSMCFGRLLLKNGLMKIIGNGRDTYVWTHLWVQDNGMRAPFIKNPLINLDLRVEELIDNVSGGWNHSLLQDLVFQDDVDKITVHTPMVNESDFWCWSHNRSGNYSVKSGYWLAHKLKHKLLIEEAQRGPSINPLKERFWYVLTSPKLKTFLWKILSRILPVGNNLKKRGIKVVAQCVLCGDDGESENHLFFKCPFARLVWAISGIPHPQFDFSDSMYKNMSFLLDCSRNLMLALDTRLLFPWILWFIWKNRNGLIFAGMRFSPQEIKDKAIDECALWKMAQAVEVSATSPLLAAVKEVPRWRPPPKPWLKCNIGVSWQRSQLLCGASWVLRDDNGVTFLHSRGSFANVSSLLQARVLCLKWSVDCIIAHRKDKVIFALENTDIIGMVSRPTAWSSFLDLTFNVRKALEGLFFWKLVHESSHCNQPASLIAQSVISQDRVHSYVVVGAPVWLEPLFASERRLIQA